MRIWNIFRPSRYIPVFSNSNYQVIKVKESNPPFDFIDTSTLFLSFSVFGKRIEVYQDQGVNPLIVGYLAVSKDVYDIELYYCSHDAFIPLLSVDAKIVQMNVPSHEMVAFLLSLILLMV